MSAAAGPAAAPPVTQKREFWVLMGYAVVLGVFGAFAGLVFIGVIKFGGKWYSDSHPGWFGGHWWWVAVAAAAGAVVGLLRRLTGLPEEVPGLFEDLKTEHVDPGLVPGVVAVSAVSLIGGASLGPEKALGTMGGGAGSWIAKRRALGEEDSQVNTLCTTPTSGLRVQLCGDAHLSNFGAFASPERRLVFDVNDFDETLPGPFEWDVKRLAASLAVAGRDNGFSRKDRRQIELAAAEGYRTAMRSFAQQQFLDVWYAHMDVEAAIGEFRSQLKAKRVKLTGKMVTQAHTHDSMQALGKLTTVAGGQRRIISDPPLIEPVEDVFADVQADAIYDLIREVMGKYRRTLQSDRKHLAAYFTLVQVARKVVGVGSVGTRAWIALMDGVDGTEPLFLQAKEAQPSVLAAWCGRSQYRNQGERVVAGQHLMQAESDIFLGWTHVVGPDGVGRDYYVRQLKDWKFSAPIEQMIPSGMKVYARLCGWTLAHAHARSGDRIALAAYLGGSAKFDQAIADFAETYADQNERDYAALQAAVKDGRAEATTEI